MAPSVSPISNSPPRRVDPRTWQILQEAANEKRQKKDINYGANNNNNGNADDKAEGKEDSSTRATTTMNYFLPLEVRDIPFLERIFNAHSVPATITEFLSDVLLLHETLAEDAANPVSTPATWDETAPQEMLVRRLSASSTSSTASSTSSAASSTSSAASSTSSAASSTSSAASSTSSTASSTSSAASSTSSAASSTSSETSSLSSSSVVAPTLDPEQRRDDRVERLYHLIRETPWKLDADQLRDFKYTMGERNDVAGGAAAVAWSVGQLLRAALYVAHCVETEEIVRLLKEERREEARASPMSSSSSSLLLQDFNWTDEGYPLMETLGMEEAAAKFDRKVETMEKIIEEEGEVARRVWLITLREMGIAEEEEEEEEDDVYAALGAEHPKEMITNEDSPVSHSRDDELVMKVIETEARNHAVVLLILRAIEKLIC